VAGKRRPDKRNMLSFDEWNVWYKARSIRDREPANWPFAPRLIEEIYDLQDALMVGGALITLINNADRVKAACLAQLVNVIGAIYAEPGGPAWRQTIFHPFKLTSQYGRGFVLRSNVRSSIYSTKTAGSSAQLLAASIHDPEDRKIVLFLLNRSTDTPTDLSIELRGFAPVQEGKVVVLHGKDLFASNSAAEPHRVEPSEHTELLLNPDKVSTQLSPLSWNTLVLSY